MNEDERLRSRDAACTNAPAIPLHEPVPLPRHPSSHPLEATALRLLYESESESLRSDSSSEDDDESESESESESEASALSLGGAGLGLAAGLGSGLAAATGTASLSLLHSQRAPCQSERRWGMER